MAATETRQYPAAGRLPGFTSQLRAEWTKLRSQRSFLIQIGLALLLAVAMSALICLAIGSTWDELSPAEQADLDPALIGISGTTFSSIVLGVLGVTCVSSEYTSGMIRLTMTVTPSRLRVLAAKAVIVAAVSWSVGLVVMVLSFFAGQLVLGSYEGVPTASLSENSAQRAIIAGWLTTPLFPLIGAAVGAILRSTASAITATLALVFVPSFFGGLLPRTIQENVLAYLPGNASDTLLQSRSDYATYLEPPVAVAVIIAWLVAFFVAAGVLLQRRDV